jgi:hypothetical protein
MFFRVLHRGQTPQWLGSVVAASSEGEKGGGTALHICGTVYGDEDMDS